jgi:hypothetical protein
MVFLLLSVVVASHHGTWVYKIDKKCVLETDPRADRLSAFARRFHLDEVYLSGGALPLNDPRAPAFIAALHRNGLRVEMLIDEREPRTPIAAVAVYNRTHTKEERIDGIHADFEPWIDKGEDISWAQGLKTYYDDGRHAAEKEGMTFAADISAAKIGQLSAEVREDLLAAASRLVLMAYDSDEPLMHKRCDKAFAASPNAAR